MSPISLAEIESAAERIRGAVLRTPCTPSVALSEIAGCEIWCKFENLQRTGSFKERGARNALLLLEPDQQRRGVVAASAGNHAAALSYHGRLLGIPVTVVMPRVAPLTKVRACEQFGARVLLHGENISQAQEQAMRFVAEQGMTYLNGYDDLNIIAGQGTLGLEVLQQVPDCDAIIVPIGGAGLIAGIALAMKSLRPHVRVVGVQSANTASYQAALEAGGPVTIPLQPTLADGLAVPRVGDNAFAVARRRVDHTVMVNEHMIALAVLRLIELEKTVVEGAGATPLAACLAGVVPELRGKKVVLPLCGGNIDTQMLGRIIERGLAADGRLCRFAANISDRPGGLARFASVLAEAGASVHHLEHDRAFAGDDVSQVMVHCVIETRDDVHVRRVREQLGREGFETRFPDDGGVKREA